MSRRIMRKVGKLRSLAAIAALVLLIGQALAPLPSLAQEGTCIDDVTGRRNTCTANDVRISQLRNEEDVECSSGDLVDLRLQAELECGSQERYDIGMFVALDGGAARTGICHRDYLPPPLEEGGTCSGSGDDCLKNADCPEGETCTGGYDPLSGIGPFYNAEFDEDPLDLCGDVEQGVLTNYYLVETTVPCVDNNGDGLLDIGTCVSWDNQKANTPSCVDVSGAIPNTKSKCRCEMITVGNVIVIPGEIQVSKVAEPAELQEPGGNVVFTFQVENTSQVNVTVTSLVDSVYGDLTGYLGTTCTLPQPLAPGESYTCQITAPVSGPPGVQPDTVTASGTDQNGDPVSDSATAEVRITDRLPAITVVKSVSPASILEPGGQVLYTVQVANGSGANDPLTLTGLVDDVYGDLTNPANPKISDSTCALVTIEPWDSYQCTFKAQVSGIAGDSIVDTVTATGTDDDGNEVQASDDATVTITGLPPDTGVKLPAPFAVGGLALGGTVLLLAAVLVRRRIGRGG